MVKRVLITGATGFIGRHCVPLLKNAAYEVHTVSSNSNFDVTSDMHCHHANLLAAGTAERLIAHVRPTHLLHLAWYTEHRKFWSAIENLHWVEASLALFRAFADAGGERAVLAGTCAEYDWSGGLCSESTTPLLPTSLYGVSKHALQSVVSSYSSLYGPSSAWGRIFFLYGPHEEPLRLVSSVIGALLDGKSANCSHGEQERDFLHVTDVASAFVALLDSDARGPINIGSGIGFKIKDVVGRIADKLGRQDLLRLGAIPTAATDPMQLVADTRRLTDEVQWRPAFSLDEGLSDTIAWCRARKSRL